MVTADQLPGVRVPSELPLEASCSALDRSALQMGTGTGDIRRRVRLLGRGSTPAGLLSNVWALKGMAAGWFRASSRVPVGSG
jgi:hypothetical protein